MSRIYKVSSSTFNIVTRDGVEKIAIEFTGDGPLSKQLAWGEYKSGLIGWTDDDIAADLIEGGYVDRSEYKYYRSADTVAFLVGRVYLGCKSSEPEADELTKTRIWEAFHNRTLTIKVVFPAISRQGEYAHESGEEFFQNSSKWYSGPRQPVTVRGHYIVFEVSGVEMFRQMFLADTYNSNTGDAEILFPHQQ